MIWKSNMDMV